ncbi:hypothetical protein [Salinilacihabitans rarus]|uniref:hypothetical protein n=1 Tax=Salinilacihabitans rarus TaxID=2961596 RepID=UPI0020C92EB0|nr:hypothetical protein [Salinilacihabitans rarus]
MVVSTVSLVGLVFTVLVTATVYLLGVRLGETPGTARPARAFRLGFPLAGGLIVVALTAVVYAAEHRFPPTAGETPLDPGLLLDLGLAGTVLGFLVAVALLAWLALASSRDHERATGEGR